MSAGPAPSSQREKLRPSAGISVSPCPVEGCACGNVVVRLHDHASKPIAGIVLPRAIAEAFYAQLGEALEGRSSDAPPELRSIRCEGTA